MSTVFVFDDEPAMGENIRRLLDRPGVRIEAFTNSLEGLRAAEASPPDAVLLDIRMPELSGEEVFARIHAAYPAVPVIFLTAYGSVEGAVLAMRNGAFDYLRKPFRREDLLLAVQRALAHREAKREAEDLKGRLEALGEADALESRSPRMAAEMEKARQAAASDATVLITGESGTGKEVLARWIHGRSPRRAGPFVPIDCTALPSSLVESELFGHEKGAFTGAVAPKRGLIESAGGGTLFLDEIGDLPLDGQARLFRFVEEREVRPVGGLASRRVDCRIVCATNQDLQEKVRAQGFREELFFRLAVVSLNLPPLRDRPEDIAALARFFLQRYSRRYGKSLSASPAFYGALLERAWPGNVRELKNLVERLVVLREDGGLLDAGDVKSSASGGSQKGDLSRLAWRAAREAYLESFEAGYARAVLVRCGGNVSAAAREAGVDRKTFYAMLRRIPGSRSEE